VDTAVVLLRNIILVLLEVFQFAFLLRAIMSWFDRGEPGMISSFLIFVTEPIVLPIRLLFEKLKWFQGSMLDVPYFFAFMLLMFVQTFLTLI
jgi:uncharacterized protein YggT (Ycf19 family)